MISEHITHVHRLARLLGEVRGELAERQRLLNGCAPMAGARPLRDMTDGALVARCQLLRHWHSAAVQKVFGVVVADIARAADAELWAHTQPPKNLFRKLLTLAKR